MGYVFLAVILAFSLTAGIYLWANDFNRETYPIVFPAIGAILLSLYLGFKVTWIDKDDPNESKVTVALLHDRIAGQILPVTGRHFVSDPPELRDDYWGLREIARYPFYTKIKGNPFWNKLKATKGDNSGSNHRAIVQLVEYAVLDWLARRAPAYNLIDSTEITLLTGGGGGAAGALSGRTSGCLRVSRKKATLSLPQGKSRSDCRSGPGSFEWTKNPALQYQS